MEYILLHGAIVRWNNRYHLADRWAHGRQRHRHGPSTKDRAPDNWRDSEVLDARTREFQADLKGMLARTGVDWLKDAAEPDLAGDDY